MSKPIRKRSEVAAEFTWDLTDIFPSDEAWRAEYEALRPYTEAVAAYQGRLGESAETLLAYFRLDDELNVRVGRLYGYANCKADEDTSNGFYQDLRGKALSLSVTLSGAGAFAASELLALSDETLTRFYAEQPGAGDLSPSHRAGPPPQGAHPLPGVRGAAGECRRDGRQPRRHHSACSTTPSSAFPP